MKKLLLVCSLLGVLKVGAATFTSIASGGFTTPSTWSVVGSDPDGIPDNTDNVIIANSFTVTLTVTSNCLTLTTNPGGVLNLSTRTLNTWGSFTNNGSVTTVGGLQFYGNGTISGNAITLNPGIITFYSSYTIGAGMTLTAFGIVNISAGTTVTNRGNLIANGTPTSLRVFPSATFTHMNGASLTIAYSILNQGTCNFSAAANTVLYKNNTSTSIISTTYYNLSLTATSTSTKTLAGDIVVRNNLTIGQFVTLNWANNDITLGGNWSNNSNNTCTNMFQLTLNGSGTQNITRAVGNTETFNHFNCAGTGTVRLADSLRVNGLLNISAGTLDVSASNFSIHCFSDFFDNSVFNARQGTVFFDGSVPQTIDGVSSTSFYNITSRNPVAVSVVNPKRLTNILTVSAGSFGTSSFGSMTLVATNATTCARIAPLGLGTSLFGTAWIIQTYINGPATAYWQYLGSPTTSSTLADWDGDTRFYMSGVGGNDGNACCPVFRSVRTYNEPTNTYTNITTTSTALTPGRGFMVWMSDNMSGMTSPLIYDTRGTPNQLNVDRAVTAGGSGAGYNLVSNPYACPVLYSSVVSASSATLSANFMILQENGSYATNPNGGTIAGGQGFMCIASSGGNLSFTESCKSTVANPNVVRQLAGNQIRIKAGNQVNGLGEETVVQLMPGGDASYDYVMDMPYLASPYDNATHIWTQNINGEQFLLNNLGTGLDHLMIPVSVVTSTPGVQTLTFKELNTVTEYNCAWLEDLTTGERINLNSTDMYEFNEDEMGSVRNFILHFERTNECSFDLQNSTASLNASSNVFVNNGSIFAQFEFETEEVVTISMYDLSGRMVMGETTMNVTKETVALTNPDAHGIYLVRIQKGNEVATKKIYY